MPPLDPMLKDLLVREAHLRRSRDQLTPVWAQKEAELRAIQSARPGFWPVFSRRKREDYAQRLAEVQQVVDVLRQGVAVLDRIEPVIKKHITEAIEDLLRADHPEYVEALAALRQKEDWMRCVERFAERLNAFASQLGNVRNIACSGYARKSNAYSKNAGEAFQAAIDAARLLEDEVAFANRISDARARIFLANGFKSRPLPKLQPTGFAAWVAKISTLPLAEAQAQFDLLSAQTKQLHDTGLPELRADAEAMEKQQTGEVHSQLFLQWEQFRRQVAPEIFPGDTARVVEETEKLLLENGDAEALRVA
jgi:hypothetical protein